MKTLSNLLLLALCITCSVSALSQEVECNEFLVLGMNPNPQITDEYLVSIQFSGNENVFIDYPHVSAVLDCAGDTIATGQIFFFGQFGQTTNDYPISISVEPGAMLCEPLTAIFIYSDQIGGDIDTCAISFGSNNIFSNGIIDESSFLVYPNPAIDLITVASSSGEEESGYVIYDALGKEVLSGRLSSLNQMISVKNLPSGMYYLSLMGESTETKRFIKE